MPKQLVINNKKITDKTEIASNFNEFFANVGPKLAEKIPDVNKKFESYIPVIDTSLLHTDLTEQLLSHSKKTKRLALTKFM